LEGQVNELRPLRVAVTGATGFVGEALVAELKRESAVIALGRRYPPKTIEGDETSPFVPGVERRRCDLFSVRDTRAALSGASVAVYLVHSMSPNARLTQGSFEDLDLLLADNFGRAAAEAGVERIVYLGGLLPQPGESSLSPHLSSRLEVEKALGARGVPVTAVRAGLVVGAEGSSLNILVRLVERLPLMVCPVWTSTRTQPIALSDAIAILVHCCRTEETAGRICEVGGPDILSYREMMQVTAKVLGRRRPMIPVPFVTPALSELWVALVTGTSRSLVRPLIESLRHPMVASDRWLQAEMEQQGDSFEHALRAAVRDSRVQKRSVVRSVQRFRLPEGRDAVWVGKEYLRWLPRFARGWIWVVRDGPRFRLGLRGFRRAMLILDSEGMSNESDRYVLRVAGGLLAVNGPEGLARLEFRVTPDGHDVLAALQDFQPRLPWWIYKWTQAPLHAAIMSAYRRFLARRAEADEQDGHRREIQWNH
jgi:uncharacterized protein YbjT (DUF2867 family)